MTASTRILTPPATPRPRPRTSPWLAIVLGSLSAFAPFAIDMYLPAFPRIARDLGCSLGRIQITLSVFLVGIAVGQLLWGTLSDHWGRRGPMLIGSLGFALAAVVCATTQSIVTLLVARFFMGLGGSAGVVVARAVVRDLFDEHESAKFYTMMMIVGGLAPIVAPSLGGLLLTLSTWRMLFVVMAIFATLCTIGIIQAVPETLPPALRARGHLGEIAGKYLRLFVKAPFISYALVIALQYGVLFSYISSSPFLFIEVFGKTPQQFSLLFATNAAGIYVAGQSNRLMLRRWSPRQILAGALMANLVVCVSLAVVGTTQIGGFPLFYGLLFAMVASMGWIFPNAIAVAMKPVADQAGSASALVGMLQFAVGAAAGSLVGVLQNGTAVPPVVMIAGFSLCSWLTLVLFARRAAR